MIPSKKTALTFLFAAVGAFAATGCAASETEETSSSESDFTSGGEGQSKLAGPQSIVGAFEGQNNFKGAVDRPISVDVVTNGLVAPRGGNGDLHRLEGYMVRTGKFSVKLVVEAMQPEEGRLGDESRGNKMVQKFTGSIRYYRGEPPPRTMMGMPTLASVREAGGCAFEVGEGPIIYSLDLSANGLDSTPCERLDGHPATIEGTMDTLSTRDGYYDGRLLTAQKLDLL